MTRIVNYAKRNPIIMVVMIAAVVTCGVLLLKNIKNYNFFCADFIDIITILIGVVIAFYLTEHLNDKRRRDDCIEHIIMEIESLISDDDNFKVNPNALMKQRSCANRIKYIKDAGFSDIKEDVVFIEQHFQEIRDLYSNHNQKDSELENVIIDINKHRGLIEDKCCKIRISLYSSAILSESKS